MRSGVVEASAWHCPSVLRRKGRPSLDIAYLATWRPRGMLAHVYIPPAAVVRIRHRKFCSTALDEHQGRRYEALHE
jgi:hypothetical protein